MGGIEDLMNVATFAEAAEVQCWSNVQLLIGLKINAQAYKEIAC